MSENAPGYTIADDYDPDGDMYADADPMAEYLKYLSHVRIGVVWDMGFTLEDFKTYIAGLRKRGSSDFHRVWGRNEA